MQTDGGHKALSLLSGVTMVRLDRTILFGVDAFEPFPWLLNVRRCSLCHIEFVVFVFECHLQRVMLALRHLQTFSVVYHFSIFETTLCTVFGIEHVLRIPPAINDDFQQHFSSSERRFLKIPAKPPFLVVDLTFSKG